MSYKLLFSMVPIFLGVGLFACASKPGHSHRTSIQPPRPQENAVALEKHGDRRMDEFFWMKERQNPKVMDHLKAENEYMDSMMKDTQKLQTSIYEELKSHMKQDDASVPAKEGDYFYYHRFEKGQEYPIYCRKKLTLEAKEQIILNVNEMAKGHDFYGWKSLQVSPDGNTLAFGEDTAGRRIYTLRFKDLSTGQFLAETIPAFDGDLAWANDNKTIFYVKQDLETLRSRWVYRHTLGVQDDNLIFEEKDETFYLGLHKSLSEKFVFITSHSTMTSEARYLDANTPMKDFVVFEPRKRGHEYFVEDGGDSFFVRTNDHAKNFRLMETSYRQTHRKTWREIIAHRPDTLLDGFHMFQSHMVLIERHGGLGRFQIIDRRTKQATFPKFQDPAYMAHAYANNEFSTKFFRFKYESMTTPETIIDYAFDSGEQTIKKRDEIPGGFVAANYESQRVFAPAADGALIPISMVYRKDVKRDASTPLYIYGYGSYGYSLDPEFNSDALALLDRGFVYAYAHVRGGSEMGKSWYENGRQMKKKNTFTDFISATEYLHQHGISSPQHTYARGESAGGLLMGAIMNMRPDLYQGIVADVPFVDVLTTMLDASIPLTTGEYDEWGNPNQKKSYEYIKSYSPYDNVVAKSYPHLLVTTAFQDSQVQYWEPAKWVARLRKLRIDQNMTLLHVNMAAGHHGKSGRFEWQKDMALKFAFFIKIENQNRERPLTSLASQ